MDYTGVSRDVVIPPTVNMVCVDIPITDDPLAMEGNETILVSISTPPGVPSEPGPSTITIIDNDGESSLHRFACLAKVTHRCQNAMHII